VLLGDLNCCPHPLDGGSAAPPRPSTTWIREMLREGGGPFVDVFRHLNPTAQGVRAPLSLSPQARTVPLLPLPAGSFIARLRL
jgi:hypothetical protein